MEDNTAKIIGGSSFIFIIGILSAIIALITRVVLARNLTLEEFGLFYAVFVFVSFFALFRNFGLGAALIKHVPEYRVKEKFDLVKSTVIVTGVWRIAISLVLAFVFFAFSDFLAVKYFHTLSASIILKLLSIFFFLSVFIDMTRNLFEAFQKPFWFPFVDFAKNAFVFVFVLLFLSFGFGILSPVFAYIIMALIVPLLFLPVLLRVFNFSKYKLIFSKRFGKKLFFFGLPFVFVSISAIVISQVDTLLLTYFRSLGEVAVYNVVLPLSMILLQFSSALAVILFPMCSELWAKGEKENLVKIINSIYKYSYAIIIPLGLVVFAFTPLILESFFGREYVQGALAMRILLMGVILYTIANVNQYVLAGIGKPKITAKIVGIVALFNFSGNLILIPYYGIVGAAIMTTLSYALALVLSLKYLHKYIELKIDYTSWVKMFFAGVLTVFMFYSLCSLFSFRLWVEFCLFGLVAIIFYVTLLLIFKIISFKELKLTLNLVKLFKD
jgi:O-antigen/teichoic acid export membrane protein